MLQLGPGLGLPAAAPGLLGRAVWAGQREVPQSAVTAPGLGVEVVVQPAQGTGVIVTVLHRVIYLPVPLLGHVQVELHLVLQLARRLTLPPHPRPRPRAGKLQADAAL